MDDIRNLIGPTIILQSQFLKPNLAHFSFTNLVKRMNVEKSVEAVALFKLTINPLKAK